jgi:3',5'-cyclic-AMP phosphodiesterase
MRILELTEKTIHRIQFLNAAKGGGVESQSLPILQGKVDVLPKGLEALLVTSDLQGIVQPAWNARDSANRLLGEVLADEYVALAAQGIVPSPSQTGVILAGDLYAAPTGDKRGASGDVRSVWQAFSDQFHWVLGVEGNHDRFGTKAERKALCDRRNLHLIDYGTVKKEGMRFGGVSGIMGDPAKPGRRDDQEFLTALKLVLEARPQVLVLHQGPAGDTAQFGDEQVTALMKSSSNLLTICGHVHWPQPIAELNPSSQVLNVDSRAIVLTCAA